MVTYRADVGAVPVVDQLLHLVLGRLQLRQPEQQAERRGRSARVAAHPWLDVAHRVVYLRGSNEDSEESSVQTGARRRNTNSKGEVETMESQQMGPGGRGAGRAMASEQRQ